MCHEPNYLLPLYLQRPPVQQFLIIRQWHFFIFFAQSLFGHIVVPAARLARLNDKTASAYTQELAVMVFGKETLATCCLTGTASGKEALPKASVEDIVGNDQFLLFCNNEGIQPKQANRKSQEILKK